MIDLRYVKKVIEMLDESSVDSIEISNDKGMKLRLSKSPPQRGGVALAAPAPMAAAYAPPAAPAAVVSPPAAASVAVPSGAGESSKGESGRSRLLEIKSPMVGTFYGAPEPGARPYVSPGDRITKGQIVCIIEAMKIMNEIESEFDGIVREVVATDAHPVEYGQALLSIDPAG
jgi:acetyl-CoA carboxylase biotin carboxyl carrier protein